MASLNSCDNEDDAATSGGTGTITGVVMDDKGQPLSDVTVTVSGVSEQAVSVTTGVDGKYTVENVSMKIHAVKFAKTDWLTIAKSVTATDFNSDKIATVNASLVTAIAKITGVITDAKNGNAPLEGVTITIGVAGTATSAADGSYTIPSLVVDTYTVTFSKANYIPVTKTINPADFINNVATITITMGGRELLRGLTATNLATADKWYYNEYRGGRNADAYPHWDWACDYMSTLDFRNAWQEQNEGTTIQIRNDGNDRNNPVDMDVFDSFVFGSKSITNDNKIMSIRMRTHSADPNSPLYWGVQVIDLAAAEPATVKVGGDQTWASEDYTDVAFDLTDYVGKEVIIAIGNYRHNTGDYQKQLVLRAIRFADAKVSGTDWLPGASAIDGWQLPIGTVRSTMPNTKKAFTGVTKVAGNRDNYIDAYRDWRAKDHVGATWCFIPLKKDPETFPSEGYLIKTNNTTEVDTKVPQAYIYSKFSIAPGSNTLTLKTRNFSSNPTYFKLTAIGEDGTVTFVAPSSNTAQSASAGPDGCWMFSHQNGDADHPNAYASFVYDLSQFNGSNVLLAFSVHNGVANSGENKLVFYAINMN